MKHGKIKENYKVPGNIPSLRLQYRFFKIRFPEDELLFQVGSYYEFYEDDSEIARMLGLKEIDKPSARNVRYGFPVRLEKAFIDKITSFGRNITVIGEEEKYKTKVKERAPRYRLVFQG